MNWIFLAIVLIVLNYLWCIATGKGLGEAGQRSYFQCSALLVAYLAKPWL